MNSAAAFQSSAKAPSPEAARGLARLAEQVTAACDVAIHELRHARGSRPYWTGELSSSALATATAVVAMHFMAERSAPAEKAALRAPIEAGLAWLIRHQNTDGGWGDTVRSGSNLSTTALVWACLGVRGLASADTAAAAQAGETWLKATVGSVEAAPLVRAIEASYGRDKTFSVPILTMCALCGRLGNEASAWSLVPQLPFEVAALPQRWFAWLRLPVVSYALPALIAIGQARHAKLPTRNRPLRRLRDGLRALTLRKLEELQPENGGFLEATPLTSFVTMSLAAMGQCEHRVARRGLEFIRASQRTDGSWPIDTNLATWVTTLAVNALPCSGRRALPEAERTAIRQWLLDQQYRTTHRYTLAAPGGWAWTDRPGGVPDADDTAGAIIALRNLDGPADAIAHAVKWLLALQNRDGGVPTFCRGWGTLPFDRSSPDITAHAIQAWAVAADVLPPALRRRSERAMHRALTYLQHAQRADGSWVPLWFGHEQHPNHENSVYGTARVLLALATVTGAAAEKTVALRARALQHLVSTQRSDGGWSAGGADSTIEETGAALAAIAEHALRSGLTTDAVLAITKGADWLAKAVNEPASNPPAPIGLYFARLWYFEALYPTIFATAALVRIRALLEREASEGADARPPVNAPL